MYKPEQLYELYRRSIFKKTKNIIPKKIKNWAKVKEKPEWCHFEKFAKLVNKNEGMIDPVVYMEAMIDFFGKWYHPKYLPSQKGIKIYKTYIECDAHLNDPDKIYKSVVSSLKFIGKYCKLHGLENADEYFYEGQRMFPTLLKHYNAGTIGIYFMAIIPDIMDILSDYPPDMTKQLTKGFREKFETYRTRALKIPKVRYVSSNINDLVIKMIKNDKKRK